MVIDVITKLNIFGFLGFLGRKFQKLGSGNFYNRVSSNHSPP